MKFVAIDRDGTELLCQTKPKLCVSYKVHKKDYSNYLYGEEAIKFHALNYKEKLDFVKKEYMKNPFREKLEKFHEETLSLFESGILYFVSDLLYREDGRNNFIILSTGTIKNVTGRKISFKDEPVDVSAKYSIEDFISEPNK